MRGPWGWWRSRALLGLGILVAWLGSAGPAAAWWAASHMVSAQVAYERLSPAARAEADRLIAVLAGAEPRADHFVPAAAWLDQVKRHGYGAFESWHFVNHPYPTASSPPPVPAGDNVLTALHHNLETLRDPAAGDFLRALALRAVIHLVADAHQPLHCINVQSTLFPDGDQGGNAFKVRWPADPDASLHMLWDDAFGLYPPLAPGEDWLRRIPAAARELAAALPADSLPQRQDLDPTHWTRESYTQAIGAYRDIEPGAAPSPAYIDRGRQVARERLALAGYRLAELLEDALAPAR
jgi:hypothetical protein